MHICYSNVCVLILLCQQMLFGFGILLLFTTAQIRAEPNNQNCKDMLQGYMTGQLSSALGTYQVEALRREFKRFTDIMEKSMKVFQEKVESNMERSQG